MKTPGQIAFDQYSKAKQGKTFDDRPIPAWVDLGNEVQQAWEWSAFAAIKYWRLNFALSNERFDQKRALEVKAMMEDWYMRFARALDEPRS